MTQRLIALLGLLLVMLMPAVQAFQESPAVVKNSLKPVDCWFGVLKKAPAHECYEMQVPENHSKPDGRKISFPVLIFRNPRPVANRVPLLHLGAGGPGAAMYLDKAYSAEQIWKESKALWLDQGRDFIVIDPRGAGLAKPRLTCDIALNNMLNNLQKNLNIRESFDLKEQDYLDCIKRFQDKGIELSAYNSLSVVRDMEMLRKALGIRQWILYGISHGSIYAQLIAKTYPDTVKAMILDSTAFPHLMPHYRFTEYTLASYEALYNYCDKSLSCDAPIEDFKQRFWALYEHLSENPLKANVPHPFYPNKQVPVLLNGNVFIEVILYGLYGKEIFNNIPKIIAGLEKRNVKVLLDDISWYLAFVLDDKFADISLITHHCYEIEPFTDHQLIAKESQALPAGYIRDAAVINTEWAELCNPLAIKPGNPEIAQASKINIPSLFLHGKFDTVTPLSHVEEQRVHFSNHQLLTYPLSHGVLGIDQCADEAAASFLLDSKADLNKITCE